MLESRYCNRAAHTHARAHTRMCAACIYDIAPHTHTHTHTSGAERRYAATFVAWECRLAGRWLSVAREAFLREKCDNLEIALSRSAATKIAPERPCGAVSAYQGRNHAKKLSASLTRTHTHTHPRAARPRRGHGHHGASARGCCAEGEWGPGPHTLHCFPAGHTIHCALLCFKPKGEWGPHTALQYQQHHCIHRHRDHHPHCFQPQVPDQGSRPHHPLCPLSLLCLTFAIHNPRHTAPLLCFKPQVQDLEVTLHRNEVFQAEGQDTKFEAWAKKAGTGYRVLCCAPRGLLMSPSLTSASLPACL
jgi:hypothetical protein